MSGGQLLTAQWHSHLRVNLGPTQRLFQFSPDRGSPHRPVFRGEAGSSAELPPAELPNLAPKTQSGVSAKRADGCQLKGTDNEHHRKHSPQANEAR
jgi:hypothetical protein